MSSPKKRVGLLVLMLLIGSLLGYSIGVYSNGGTPTIDELTGISGLPWLNATTGINTPEFYLDSEFYWNSVNRTDTLAYPEHATSYIIFKSGSDTYAKNGSTGQIDYGGSWDAGGIDGANAAAVFETVTDNHQGTILVKYATYYFDSKWDFIFKDNITIIGENYPTLDFSSSPADTHSIHFTNAENIRIKGLRVIHSKRTAIIGGGSNIFIEDNIVWNSSLQGINIYGNNIIIKGNYVNKTHSEFGILFGGAVFNGIITDNIVEDATEGGIEHGYSGRGITIADNIVKGGKGIQVLAKNATAYPGGETVNYLRDLKIVDNIILDSTDQGIKYFIYSDNFDSKRIDIKDNKIVSPTLKGIYVVLGGGVTGSTFDDFTISNNEIYLAGTDGIYSNNVPNIVIGDNQIKNSADNDIELLNSANFTIKTNYLYGSGGSYSIKVESTCSGLMIIKSNDILDSQTGIYLGSNETICKNNIISGTTYDGIYLGGDYNHEIIDNTLRNIGRDGIRSITAGASTIKRNTGFVTENEGTAEASNDDWIAHGLAGEPDYVFLNVEESDAPYSVQAYEYNSTHFRFYLYDIAAAGAENVNKTIEWYAVYEP